MNRREFIIGVGSVAGVAAIGGWRYLRPGSKQSAIIGPSRYTSANGLVSATIETSQGWVAIAGRAAYLCSFNGRVPGPMLEVRSGDTLRLNLINKLPEATNLHYHGMHVSPSGNADNIFLHIASGASHQYEFTIPADHPAGLFWYHPHLHGLVAKQVSRGLAAPLVVRGPLDQVPEIAAAKEEFLVLQDFSLDTRGQVIEPSMSEQMHGREGSLATTSGKVNPTYTIQKYGLLRLRILNASVARYYLLRLEEHPLYVVGTDGGAVPAPQAMDQLLLAPGQRADILIRGKYDSGSYRLLNLPYDRGSMEMMGGGMMGGARMGEGPQARQILATVTYQGRSPRAWNIPSRLVEVPELPPTNIVRRFKLSQGMAMTSGMSFLINGKQFDANRVDSGVRLNTVEEWEYENTTGMDHPMHLHINPFQVIGPDGKAERAWRDIINVRRGSIARFRVQYRSYPGKTVQHCHILDHEDRGMMATVEINE